SLLSCAMSVARSPDITRASSQLFSFAGLLLRASARAGGDVTDGFFEKTTLGISFIGAAYTSVEKGQYDAMSRKVRLPMMWTPACQTDFIVQSTAPASIVAKIQSTSLFAPPTKPSTDIDIFKINLRMARSPVICC